MTRTHPGEAIRLAQQGHLTSSIEAIEAQIAADGPTMGMVANLGALHLQLGNLEVAARLCGQAIELDPYCYVGYFNRFLVYFSGDDREGARKQLHKALSCLYLVRGLEEGNAKYLNRAILYCEHNARAYLCRAKLNELRNNKLAENDYSAAIEYDPNLFQIYQQRALFYRKLNRRQEFEADLALYLRLQRTPLPITELIDNEQDDDEQGQSLQEKIEEEAREFQDLLLRVQGKYLLTQSAEYQQGISKLPLSGLQSQLDKKDDDELLLSDRPDQTSTQTITIKKEEIQFRKRPCEEEQGHQSYREMFEDENSRELDSKIDRLERQIVRDGGQILFEKVEQQADPEEEDTPNFLTEEIEKAINEISKLSSPDNLNEIKSARSAGSNGSLGSRLSESKDLTEEEFGLHRTIQIEVVSLEDIQSHNRKETSKVVLRYGGKTVETEMGKCEWREEFSFGVQGEETEMEVSVVERGGIFRADNEVAEGSINLLETNVVKCILGNRERKVAILYFKLSLV